ncbi:MAG: chitobiase/beta-hexosaminidase C-terminal domain-containing protein [Kiritimatiellae bacterium]|nr:chitobiase/beta-hexosaminidase C-terminal domain-containing protein [Kiritimatiellia bacterium]
MKPIRFLVLGLAAACGAAPAADAMEEAPAAARYEIVPWTNGWHAAVSDAESRGGHLATITSEKEWETVRNLFPLRDLLGCWLGASDAEEEGVWQWVTGEPWDFARWDAATGQPDAMREGQDYLWLHVNYAGRWDDIEGNDPGAAKYLLEREDVPQGAVSDLRPAFSLSPPVLSVEAAGGTREVEVDACEAWSATERVPWISLKKAHGRGPGKLLVKVAANESPEARCANVRVRTTWSGEWRDITVEQGGMERVAMPRIRQRGGGIFEGPKQRVVIACATEGAAIRYTLDGSEPDGTSALYTGAFNISATTTVKARAFRDGMLPSGTIAGTFVRLPSLAEVLGIPEGTVATDRFAGWRVEENAGREGGPAARSGPIGPDGRSRMELRVEGAGTVAFWWKVSCEDDPDGTGWDRTAFSVDGIEKAAIDGESGWQRVEAEVKGEGVHVLAWEYAKDWFDEAATADAAWVGEVAWHPADAGAEAPTAEGAAGQRAGLRKPRDRGMDKAKED